MDKIHAYEILLGHRAKKYGLAPLFSTASRWYLILDSLFLFGSFEQLRRRGKMLSWDHESPPRVPFFLEGECGRCLRHATIYRSLRQTAWSMASDFHPLPLSSMPLRVLSQKHKHLHCCRSSRSGAGKNTWALIELFPTNITRAHHIISSLLPSGAIVH